jgi:LacI family transcriptional regulator
VLEAAEKFGYKPEETKTQDLICYVLCNRKIDLPHYYEQLRALEQEASDRNFRIVFMTVDHTEEEYAKMAGILNKPGVKGAVLAGDFNYEITRRIQEIQVPFVATTGVTYVEGINLVTYDHFQAGFEATEYLIKLGHKRIAYFTGELYRLTYSQILAGYREAHKNHGLFFDPALVQISHAVRGDDLVQRMKELAIDYSAIVTVNEQMGIEALNELKTEGRVIPGEVSVIAIGGGHVSQRCKPKLSVMGGGEESMATLVFDILEKDINNFNLKPETAVVKNKLIERESTGPFMNLKQKYQQNSRIIF